MTILPIHYVQTVLQFLFDPPNFWELCQCSPHMLAPASPGTLYSHPGSSTAQRLYCAWHQCLWGHITSLTQEDQWHLWPTNILGSTPVLVFYFHSCKNPHCWMSLPSLLSNSSKLQHSTVFPELSSPPTPAIWRTGGYKVSTISVQLIPWH